MHLSCKTESTEGWPFVLVKKACAVTALGSWQVLKDCLQPQLSELEAQENSDMPSVPWVLTGSTSAAIVLSSQEFPRDTPKNKVFRAVKHRWFRVCNINNSSDYNGVSGLKDFFYSKHVFIFHVYKSCFVMWIASSSIELCVTQHTRVGHPETAFCEITQLSKLHFMSSVTFPISFQSHNNVILDHMSLNLQLLIHLSCLST